MSIISWKAMFYEDVSNSKLNELQAAIYSLWKWKGLLSDNMWLHWIIKLDNVNVIYDKVLVKDADSFKISYSTEALCAYHTKSVRPDCSCCCLRDTCKADTSRFIEIGDPLPRINSIKMAISKITNEIYVEETNDSKSSGENRNYEYDHRYGLAGK